MIAIEQQRVSEIAEDVFAGLSGQPKSLPAKLFYDAAGSDLFEQITQLPEYYLTRAETEILVRRAGDICHRAGLGLTVVELGAGTAQKTRLLLQALSKRQLIVPYVPVDVCEPALREAADALERDYPAVRVRPQVSDFSDLGFLRHTRAPRLVLYIGSSIGNFDPPDALALMRRLRAELSEGDHLLLGTDLVKDRSVLVPAYDDAAGVTARFNKNVLARINRELGGQFDLDQFEHVARWNPEALRMEMYLRSRCDQAVRIAQLEMTVTFAAGELLHTENSHKYTVPGVRRMLSESGYALTHTWTDAREWYGVSLAKVV